jgi:hypothetical protein
MDSAALSLVLQECCWCCVLLLLRIDPPLVRRLLWANIFLLLLLDCCASTKGADDSRARRRNSPRAPLCGSCLDRTGATYDRMAAVFGRFDFGQSDFPILESLLRKSCRGALLWPSRLGSIVLWHSYRQEITGRYVPYMEETSPFCSFAH